MDPIHPILPQKINIPPVTEPPRIGRIDRDDPREDRDRRDGRGRRRPDEPDGEPITVTEDEAGPHVDITA